MRRARFPRAGLALFLFGWAAISGCTHNYYYGNAVPVCGPSGTVVPGVVQNGAVCDVPSTVSNGTVVSQTPSRSSVVGGSPPPRVVLSEPGTRSRIWKPMDPESSVATTRVEGAIDDSTVNR